MPFAEPVRQPVSKAPPQVAETIRRAPLPDGADEAAGNHVWRQVATGMEPATPGADAGVPDAAVADAGPAPRDASPPAGTGPPAPSGPNACPTQEEEDRKNRFRLRTFTLTNYRPSTGLGRFDATYWPLASLMFAVTKLNFNFVPADNTPDIFTLAWMAASGQDINRFFWSAAEKQQFKDDYVRRTTSRWSFRYRLESDKPCWPFTAHPLLTPQLVDNTTASHFNITVHKSSGPGIDYKSAAGLGRSSGKFWSSDVQENPNFRSSHVARAERRRLEQIIAGASASPILFDRDSPTVKPADAARLRTLAQGMKAKNPSDPAIPVTLEGYASMEGGRARNRRLSRERAEAVRSILSAESVPQPLRIDPKGPVGAPDDAANRKVLIVPDTAFETTYGSNRYSVAEHEFGHLFGLPDEYLNQTTGFYGTVQSNFVRLTQAAGVAAPHQWGASTSSQMASGVDILPRHYVTLWEALGRMTDPDIPASNWKIV